MRKKLFFCWLFFTIFSVAKKELYSSSVLQELYHIQADPRIEFIAIFSVSEQTGLPGIMTQLKTGRIESKKYFWKLTAENNILPAQFREAPNPVFYFPEKGLYTLEVKAMDQYGSSEQSMVNIQVSEDEVVLIYPEEEEIVFTYHEFTDPSEVWSRLELTGSSAKPATLLGQPWYIVAGGGIAASGIAVALWPEKDEPQPFLKANDVNLQINCPEGAVVFPLQNDEGKGLFIKSISGLSADIGEFIPPDQILIYEGLKQNLTFNYTLGDQFGKQASAEVRINVILPPMELQNHQLKVKAGESAELNLLENSICSNCNIIDLEQPLTGSFSLEDNLFIYTAEIDYGGDFQIQFTAEDECGQQKVASVLIEVIPLCDAEFTFDKGLPDCGLDNGWLEVVGDTEGDFAFLWDIGSTVNRIEDLSSAEYSLTIIDQLNGCEYSEIVVLGEKEAAYAEILNAIGGNCLSSADAELEFNSAREGILNIAISGKNLNEATTISITDQMLLSLSQLWSEVFWEAGNYTLEIGLDEAGDQCIQTLTFSLEEVPTDLTGMDDEYSIGSGQLLRGNVLENDEGTGLTVSSYEEPEFGSLNIEDNGDFIFETTDDESGTISVEYELTDSCGYTGTAFLIIEVFPCVLDFELEITDSPCGEDQGRAEFVVDNPDLYEFEWSTIGVGPVSEGMVVGSYSVTITEIETACVEVLEFEIETLPPLAVTDSFKVLVGDTLSGDLLTNDIGFELVIVDFGPQTGSFAVEGDGGFTYFSTDDFTGKAEFWYLIEDACGGRDSGVIIIEVLPLNCEPEVVIEADSATCGLSDAMVVALITADCDFEIIWHDNSRGDTLFNQAAGNYELKVVTGGGGFEQDTLIFPYTIFEKNPNYITEVFTEKPNCYKNGQIQLELNSPGDGEFIIVVQGPTGLDTTLTSDSSLSLGDVYELVAGDYLIIVKDISLECGLADTLSLNLEEEDVLLELVNDTLVLFSGENISFDLFVNDTGTGLMLLDIEDPPFGSLTAAANGKGIYSADLPKHGVFELKYRAKDSCDQESTALLVIEVILPPCEFEVEFEKTDADCGYDNGVILTTINPESQYTYMWSNGTETKDLSNLAAGTYSLTVTDELRLCSLDFQAEIKEKASNWIQDINVIPEGCALEADIILELLAPGNDQLIIVINGGVYNNFQLTVPQGTVSLNDYVGLTSGIYFFDVTPLGSQNYCKENTSAQIVFTSNPVSFSVTQAIPPSSPQGSNGQISIEISGGFPPYELHLNGEHYGTTSQNTYTFTNLSQGNYEIEVVDAQFCSGGTETVDLFISGNLWLKNHTPVTLFSFDHHFIKPPIDELIEFNLDEIKEVFHYPLNSIGIGLQWQTAGNWLAEVRLNQNTSISTYQLSNSQNLMDWNKITTAQVAMSMVFSLLERTEGYLGVGSSFLEHNRELSWGNITQSDLISVQNTDQSLLMKGGIHWNLNERISLESGLSLEYFFQQKKSIYLLEAQLRYEF
ncbi:MAG: hypothetical protein EA362_14070 [Saprospirales bacterium]|nr:MAG: hypothetical protein EA362_14070 [Saprospirales bacterium]